MKPKLVRKAVCIEWGACVAQLLQCDSQPQTGCLSVTTSSARDLPHGGLGRAASPVCSQLQVLGVAPLGAGLLGRTVCVASVPSRLAWPRLVPTALRLRSTQVVPCTQALCVFCRPRGWREPWDRPRPEGRSGRRLSTGGLDNQVPF